jgi:hypothetical protein
MTGQTDRYSREVIALRAAGFTPRQARRFAHIKAVARANGKEPVQVTFQEYAAARPITDDPIGDFVSDFRRDRRPWGPLTSRASLSSQLRQRGACTAAINAASATWREYESAIRDTLTDPTQ